MSSRTRRPVTHVEAPDLTEAEKAALAYADLAATDHLAISDATSARPAAHLTTEEQMDLCFQDTTFVGYGRLDSALAMTDDLPDEYAVLAPWRQAPQSVV